MQLRRIGRGMARIDDAAEIGAGADLTALVGAGHGEGVRLQPPGFRAERIGEAAVLRHIVGGVETAADR